MRCKIHTFAYLSSTDLGRKYSSFDANNCVRKISLQNFNKNTYFSACGNMYSGKGHHCVLIFLQR